MHSVATFSGLHVASSLSDRVTRDRGIVQHDQEQLFEWTLNQ
jgi:hypothetical protein